MTERTRARLIALILIALAGFIIGFNWPMPDTWSTRG